MKPDLRPKLTQVMELTEKLAHGVHVAQSDNLKWLTATLRFTLLLDTVGQGLEPAYRLRIESLVRGDVTDERMEEARRALEAAPVRELFETYASRIRSRGELGVLSSLHQRLWLEYRELQEFMKH